MDEGTVPPVHWKVFDIIKEIYAKTLLTSYKADWRGTTYTMNIYRGCQHGCIYCDSRSECYQIENFDDILVKVNAIELLEKELRGKRVKGTIHTGSMSDPYTPIEKQYSLTRRAMELIARYSFPVHVITKSDLILRDIDIYKEINKVYTSINFTITTTDDKLAKMIEPATSLPSARFKVMEKLSSAGIYTGVWMSPILPFIEDNEDNIRQIVKLTAEHGGKYIVTWFGMTLRDRQRAYYYDKMDRLFPGLRKQYEEKFGLSYSCSVNNREALEQVFKEACNQYGIATYTKMYESKEVTQISLFD